MIDRAFIDRAEELGIKELLVAFAESLAEADESVRVNGHLFESDAYSHLVTTLRRSTCTCGTVTDSRPRGSTVPVNVHFKECAWSRFITLFATEPVEKKFWFKLTEYRNWAKRVTKNPDSEPYGNVVKARAFLEQEAREAEAEKARRDAKREEQEEQQSPKSSRDSKKDTK